MDVRREPETPWKVIGAWLFLLIVGFGISISYESSAAPVGRGKFITQDVQTTGDQSEQFKIVVAAHPRCPCTRATIHELQRLLCRAHTPVSVEVLFYRPVGSSPSWSDTDLLREALAIKNCRAVDDPGGMLSLKYGAHTSGETMLFGRGGRLIFHGGITGLRGHEGDNRGEDEIISALDGDDRTAAQTPIYGCSLGNWSAD